MLPGASRVNSLLWSQDLSHLKWSPTFFALPSSDRALLALIEFQCYNPKGHTLMQHLLWTHTLYCTWPVNQIKSDTPDPELMTI